MTLTFKQGDTRHAIKATLSDVDGNPIDLAGASVRFFMYTRTDKQLIDRAALINGMEVWYVFESGDTDTAGLMQAEFRVTYPDGRLETFPHDGYLQIYIQRKLGGA